MEADFTRYYHTDLRLAVWGPEPWSVRRLLSHIKNLPPEAALVRRLRGEQAFWTWDTELAAATFDALQQLTFYTLSIAGAKGVKEPKPFPRPGTAKPEAKPVSLGAFNRFLEGAERE